MILIRSLMNFFENRLVEIEDCLQHVLLVGFWLDELLYMVKSLWSQVDLRLECRVVIGRLFHAKALRLLKITVFTRSVV